MIKTCFMCLFICGILLTACSDSSDTFNNFKQDWQNNECIQSVSVAVPERGGLFYSPLDENRKQIYTDFLNSLEVFPKNKMEFEDTQLVLEMSVNTDHQFWYEYTVRFYSNKTGSLWDNVKDEWSYFTFESPQWQYILEEGYDYVEKQSHK